MNESGVITQMSLAMCTEERIALKSSIRREEYDCRCSKGGGQDSRLVNLGLFSFTWQLWNLFPLLPEMSLPTQPSIANTETHPTRLKTTWQAKTPECEFPDHRSQFV